VGIDEHGLKFLDYVYKSGDFGKTITIGRQSIHLPIARSRVLKVSSDTESGEELLVRRFGANLVDSIDHSPYEGANIIHDLNLVVPPQMVGQYDTIIDFGSSEHVFNVPAVFQNYVSMCKPGSRILHVLPANNFCGHGFFQFSPELFFSLYSEINGFSLTEVFLANLNDLKHWYLVKKPSDGTRVNVHSSSPIYVMVKTTVKRLASQLIVQQSDYEYMWAQRVESAPSLRSVGTLTSLFGRFPSILKIVRVFWRRFLAPLSLSLSRLRSWSLSRLSSRNAHLEKIKVT